MALTAQSAARKDRNSGKGEMQHRHFATVAAIIQTATFHGFKSQDQRKMADMFAHELPSTNPRFDRKRFLTACGFGS